MRRRSSVLPIALLLIAVLAAGCGTDAAEEAPTPAASGDTTSRATGTPTPAPRASTAITIDLTEWTLTPAVSRSSAADFTFGVRNAGAVPHQVVVLKTDAAVDQLELNGDVVRESKYEVIARTATVPSGARTELAVRLDAGSYILLCNLPGHYQRGVRSALLIR